MTGACDLGGGIAAANLNVLSALAELSRRAKRRLIVLSLHEKDDDRPLFLPARVTFRGFRGRKWHFALALLSSYRPGTLHIVDHVHLALPLTPFLAAGAGKLVVFAHGSECSTRLRRTSRWLFRHTTLCLANSNHTLERMRAHITSASAVECLLGLPPHHELNASPPATNGASMSLTNLAGEQVVLGRRGILLVARMDSSEGEKGHYRLLDAWPEVLAHYPDAQIVFVGAGDDQNGIASYARRLGVARSVFMPGHVATGVLTKLYSWCLAFVMPSLQEGFGLVYLEAMNHAKACVGCAGDGAECVIVDGETGYLLRKPGCPEELAEIVRRLFDHEHRTAQLGANGLKRLHDRFTAGHAQRRILRHLGTVV